LSEGVAVAFEQVTDPTSADLAAIIALESDSFSNPWSPEALTTLIRSAATRVYVARDATGIVAFCACWAVDYELHINTLAVARPHRRRGIGLSLMRFALASAKAERATLEVRQSNVAALRLYEKLGFKATAVRKQYYREPDEDALILWWNP
jgi:ribosomal-protein-alanine N-acetyltransferase